MFIRLVNSGYKKIAVIKCVRALTGLNLRDAKHLVDSAPVDIPPPATHIPHHILQHHVKELIEAGASIEGHLDSTALDKISAAGFISDAQDALGDGNVEKTRRDLRMALSMLGDFMINAE